MRGGTMNAQRQAVLKRMRDEPHDWGNETVQYVMRSPVVCADGFTVSIQASYSHYCSPRTDADMYGSVELGFPNAPDSLIKEYADDYGEGIDYTATVYAYVPADIVIKLINKHGGIVSGQCPPLKGAPDGVPRVSRQYKIPEVIA